MVVVWNTLYTSQYGRGMEHPVYITVWSWYRTLCIHQSVGSKHIHVDVVIIKLSSIRCLLLLVCIL
jgi:hypothetical protein